ncbi:MAG: CubicO group peptidase (beta-lactamase class C family) [Pseudohongiellaceae bacterium]|jgi:CubicO group peptidase (beta-lactamase class C family)
MPADLYAAVVERHAHERPIQRIQMDFDRNWVLLAEDWFASSGIDGTAFDWIKDFQRKQRSLDNIMLGPGGAWVLFSHGAFGFDLNQGMDSIEYGLKGLHPDGSNVSNIWQRMEDLNVAGVSMGVIENGRLRWARSYGELEADTQRFARSTSPFDAASLSKTVAATLAMNLMDDPQVPVFLDGNVKYYALAGPVIYWNDLLLWALYGGGFKPEPLPFLAITMRRCLSHSAAMLPHGSTSFLPGQVPPTTLETLFGKKYVNGNVTWGGSSMPWYQEDLFSDGGSYQPGEAYKYSGGGFMVAQAMMEAITGGDFRTMAQDRILDPLQMDDTTFAAPLPAPFAARAAVAHDDAGQPIPVNKRKFYPWAAAGGMWTTPTDLAQVVLALMGNGTNQDLGVQLLQPLTAQQMMTKQTPVGESKRYGLGLSLSANLVDSLNDEWFAHSGGHTEAATYLAGSPGRGEGIVIMINGGGDAGAEVLRSELYATFKDFYDWN